ncbi:hypothetical protein N0V86_002876 [Didymella sp. IMI 355093]|nr:hypothetical protein N0V86_002876 [Didymella sp. IMI 355093]
MPALSTLPTRILKLTSEIKERQQDLEKLYKAEKKSYKTYVRARTKLMSKKYQSLQDKKTKKWYNLWVKSINELHTLIDQIKQEETALSGLKERRANQVAQDRVKFENELLQR